RARFGLGFDFDPRSILIAVPSPTLVYRRQSTVCEPNRIRSHYYEKTILSGCASPRVGHAGRAGAEAKAVMSSTDAKLLKPGAPLVEFAAHYAESMICLQFKRATRSTLICAQPRASLVVAQDRGACQPDRLSAAPWWRRSYSIGDSDITGDRG